MRRIKGNHDENVDTTIRLSSEALAVVTSQQTKLYGNLQRQLGDAYMERAATVADTSSAISAYEAALTVQSKERSPLEWARTNALLGVAYVRDDGPLKLGVNQRAIAAFESALELITRETQPELWAQVETELAQICSGYADMNREDELERAIGRCREALKIRSREMDPEGWAETSIILGNLYRLSGGDRAQNIETALVILGEVVNLELSGDRSALQANLMMALGLSYRDRAMGDRRDNQQQSIDCFRSVLDLCRSSATKAQRATALMHLASVYTLRVEGDAVENLEQAIDFYRGAINLFDQATEPMGWAMVRAHLAIAYTHRKLGVRDENLQLAVSLFEEALLLWTPKSAPFEWARTQLNLGNSYLRLAQTDPLNWLEQAVQSYELALTVWTRDRFPQDWAIVLENLAHTRQLHAGDNKANVEQAIQEYHQVLEVRIREKLPFEWAQTLFHLASAEATEVNGRPPTTLPNAIEHLQQVLEVWTPQVMSQESLHASKLLGDLFFSQQRWQEAAAAFDQAMEASELLYMQAAERSAQEVQLRNFKGVTDRGVLALAKLDQLERAVVFLERGRARMLADALDLDSASMDEIHPEDRKSYDETRAFIRNLQAESRLPEGTPGRRGFLELSQALRKAHADLSATVAAIREYLPTFEAPLTYASIQEAARLAPLIYWLSQNEGALVLIVPREVGKRPTCIWLDALGGKVGENLFLGYLGPQWWAREHPGDKAAHELWHQALDNSLHALGEAAMIAILAALDNESEAVFIPCGLLIWLPLHAAWITDVPVADVPATPTRRYLCDVIGVRYAFSAKAALQAQKMASSRSFDRLLAIAEPRPSKAPPLPSAEIEVEAAARQFSDHLCLVHEEASKEAVKQQLAAYSVFHFACHGVAYGAHPLTNGLLLGGDQTLTLRELLDFRLNRARLAVLSACETGAVGQDLPDEVVGLPAGLLQAGVPGVVASFWSVPDFFTTLVMIRFYEMWAGERLLPRVALNTAQAWVRNTTNGEKALYFASSSGRSLPKTIADAMYKATAALPAGQRYFQHPYHWSGWAYFGI